MLVVKDVISLLASCALCFPLEFQRAPCPKWQYMSSPPRPLLTSRISYWPANHFTPGTPLSTTHATIPNPTIISDCLHPPMPLRNPPVRYDVVSARSGTIPVRAALPTWSILAWRTAAHEAELGKEVLCRCVGWLAGVSADDICWW